VRRKGPVGPRLNACPGRRRLARALLAAAAFAFAPAAHANGDDGAAPFRDTFGEVGMLEMPSAEMADDGQLSLTFADLKNTRRFALGFQLFPWLEGSFRYSSITDFNGQSTDFDRSFGLKARLFQETEWTPDIALGIRDIVGTGIYGSEYLVATKHVWDFDVTAGLGWGRLADDGTFTNPFGALFTSFKTREQGGGATGGQVNFGQFFHGPDMGLFGGIVWHTPINNLDFMAEYSSDRYKREGQAGVFVVHSPINVGLAYRPLSNLTLTGGYLYGTSWGLTASLSLDPTKEQVQTRMGVPPLPAQTRTDDQQRAAVTGFVKQENSEISIAQGGPWVGHGASGPDAKIALVSQVNNSSASVRGAEINGRTLVIDARAGAVTAADCRRYAILAAASAAPVESVAMMDLDHGKGEPVMCQVDRPQLPRTLYARIEQMDSFADAANDISNGGSQTAAPPIVPALDVFDKQTVERGIAKAAAAQGLRIEAVGMSEHAIIVYYSQTSYYDESEAIGRLARVLLTTTPPSIESLKMVAVVFGIPQQQVEVLRAPIERMFAQGASPVEIAQAISFHGPSLNHPILDAAQSQSYPRFDWSISPNFRQELFDPQEPVQIQLLAALSGTIEVMPGLNVSTLLEGNIYNDFRLGQTSNSLLPHVRSDFAEYLKHGINGISNLYASYDTRLATDVFAEIKAGYLEDMYAGVGVQALWRPEGDRWALGIDAYEVQKRNFDRLFGLQDYRVLTGHVSVYYQSPWYDLNFAIHAGRYLARDYGATFEVTREFSTGVEIGAFATFTNVPFSKFGEGSFDKGLIIRIPLEWALPFHSQSAYALDLRPLTRDGGQRLLNDNSLYDETRRTSYGEVVNHSDEIGYP
jgi:hypothetical protein